jgi:hypothetical protein
MTVSITAEFVVMDAGAHLVYMVKMPYKLMEVITMKRFGLIAVLDRTLPLGSRSLKNEELSDSNMISRKNHAMIVQLFFGARHVLYVKRRVNSRFGTACQVNLFCLSLSDKESISITLKNTND